MIRGSVHQEDITTLDMYTSKPGNQTEAKTEELQGEINESIFTAICKASPDSHFAFLHFFSMGMVLIPVSCTMSLTSVHSSSGSVSIRSSPLNLFLTSTV